MKFQVGIAGLPVSDTDMDKQGRQGILEIPKQVATIIREAISEGFDRVFSSSTSTTTTTTTTSTTVKPKIQQSQSNPEKPKTNAPTKVKSSEYSFAEDFLSNNFLSNINTEPTKVQVASEAPEVSTSTQETADAAVAETKTPEIFVFPSKVPPTESDSSFTVVENAFPIDFDDGVSIVGIVSTTSPTTRKPPARRSTPSPPKVVTPDEKESESTTTEQFEEETTEEPAETTTSDPDEDDDTTVASNSSTADPDDDGEGVDEAEEENGSR
jgi:hypothetical protein